jgi:hypothetical protein
MDGAIKHPIQPQQAGLFVELVLVFASHGYFDDHGKCFFNERVVDINIVPSVHGAIRLDQG